MRLILILLVLLAIGLMVARQLHSPTRSASLTTPANARGAASDGNQPPKVPTNPKNLKSFQKGMNQFMSNAAKRQREQIEKQTR